MSDHTRHLAPRRLSAESFRADDPPARGFVDTMPLDGAAARSARMDRVNAQLRASRLEARRRQLERQHPHQQQGVGWLAAAQRVCLAIGLFAIFVAGGLAAGVILERVTDEWREPHVATTVSGGR